MHIARLSKCPVCGYHAFNGSECFDCGYRSRRRRALPFLVLALALPFTLPVASAPRVHRPNTPKPPRVASFHLPKVPR